MQLALKETQVSQGPQNNRGIFYFPNWFPQRCEETLLVRLGNVDFHNHSGEEYVYSLYAAVIGSTYKITKRLPCDPETISSKV